MHRTAPDPLHVRHLRDNDAEDYVELRRAALQEAPLAFAASPADDLAATAAAVRELLQRGPDAVIIGAFRPHLVGTVGLYRDRHGKAAHKVHLWGMYVAPDMRGRGIGSRLLDAAVRHAGTRPGVSWVHLSVSAAAPAAQRLYERAGFRVWGTEPDAMRYGGQTVDENHMVLHLNEDADTSRDRLDMTRSTRRHSPRTIRRGR